ncbi:phosphatidate cytidylyltransferase [Herbinix luporum]|uniref:phosphatidate cytidylyltransferase n=1 Tax=Herbinix luporum TaxID=1679721 RepID=UPI00175E1D34|nr:phosphatidate cytidylyltransferase [Herbinix luporum]HHT57033.1 phosphatidate cytidylyltransferase [Herbinix luporum]
MFKTRLISSIILMAITITVVVLGNDLLFTTILAISLIGMTELYKIMKIEKALLGIIGYLAAILYYGLIYFKLQEYMMVLIIGFLLLLMISYVITYPSYRIEQVVIAFFGLFYVSVMLSYIYQVRIMEDGAILVWLIFIGAWGSDTCAYCVGMLIGKHKIVPRLSPKKSLEGSIGGVVGAALIGYIYALALGSKVTGIDNPRLLFAIIGAASSVISQIGDWAASAIKRNYNIKDYGNLIPGHGGILDRFDSMIFTAPIVYYLAEFF